MERAHWHTFQVLTKRSSLMRDFLRRRYGGTRGPRHMWFGVSVEDAGKTSRIRHLQDAPAGVRFLSIEPLIGPVGTLDDQGVAIDIEAPRYLPIDRLLARVEAAAAVAAGSDRSIARSVSRGRRSGAAAGPGRESRPGPAADPG